MIVLVLGGGNAGNPFEFRRKMLIIPVSALLGNLLQAAIAGEDQGCGVKNSVLNHILLGGNPINLLKQLAEVHIADEGFPGSSFQ